MENLKRYGPSVTENGFGTMQQLDNGGWVKFSDIKELLQTAHNKQSTPCDLWSCDFYDNKLKGCSQVRCQQGT
jgi:hypothetical protein